MSGWSTWIVTLPDIGKPPLVGILIFSFGFSLLAYPRVHGVWHLRVRLKRRRRLRRRGHGLSRSGSGRVGRPAGAR